MTTSFQVQALNQQAYFPFLSADTIGVRPNWRGADPISTRMARIGRTMLGTMAKGYM